MTSFNHSLRAITNISILKNYIHLRYIDLSNNNLKDISPLNGLTHILTLKLDYNQLTSAKLDPLPYLQQASFSNNKIKTTEGISHPKLETLNLNGNSLKCFFSNLLFALTGNNFLTLTENSISEVKGFDGDKLPNLQTLELRKNHLKSTRGIRLPSLKSLFIVKIHLFLYFYYEYYF